MVGAQVLPSARSETVVRQCTARKPFVLACARGKQQPQRYVPKAACEVAQHLVGGLAAAAILLVPHAALANARLPPVDSDPNRCERAFVGNTLGMANAVSDKLLDLRGCVYTGKNLADKVLSGALASDADFSKTVMSNVTMTKSYAKGANFSGEQACYLSQALMSSIVALPSQCCINWLCLALMSGSRQASLFKPACFCWRKIASLYLFLLM
ncbi:hypothetical protein ABBQ38_012500 [Trebouxia sp. C0009 RCD-2024]